MASTLRLATRGSPLALRQYELVAAALTAVDSSVTVDAVVVQTTGDRDLSPLDEIGGQGIFTAEVQRAVLDGRADAAVHSAKDLPPVTHPGLILAAIPERADRRDALVGSAFADIPAGGVVATGSARRRAQIASLRPDLTFSDLRGNMETRARRASDGSADAVVVAVAAFERLGWSDRLSEKFSVADLLPQVGQGALALECRDDDPRVAEMLGSIDHPKSHRAVAAERAFLEGMGGDCAVPVAATADVDEEGRIHLDAMVMSGDGRIVIRASLDGDDPTELGRRTAHHVLEKAGGSSVIEWDIP